MSMTNRLIEGALPITAKLLADDLGLKIHFGAQKFSASVDATGGKHLNVPSLPLDDRLASALALGGIVHEDGHFNATDFSSMDVGNPLLKLMTNILEDIRCESLEIKRYPGARAVLARMVGAMIESGQFVAIDDREGLAGMPWYVLYRLRADVLGQVALKPLAIAAADVIKPHMPGASFQRLTAMMFEVLDCKGTADCVNLAQQMLDMLQEESENPSPQEQQQEQQDQQQEPQQEQQQQQQENQAQGDQNDQSDQTSASGNGGDGDDSGKNAGTEHANEQSDGSGTNQGATGSDAGDGTEAAQGSPSPSGVQKSGTDAQAAMKQFLAGAGAGMPSMDTGDMIAGALDVMSQTNEAIRLPEAIPFNRELGNGEDVLSRLRAETNAVRRKIQGLLEAKARSTLLNGRSGNRLDAKRLWRVRTGDARVFEKRIEGQKQDTAIQLLIDRSTSMRRDIQVACDAALAVALAMDGVQGVSTSVAAFPHVGNHQDDDVLLISGFGESFRRVAARFPAVGVQGCTPMAQAVLWSGYNLHASTKERKILVVVTDGKPDNQEATAAVIDKLQRSGVEVMGLGINVDVDGLFQTSARIGSVGELAVALFGMLQEKLAKAA